MNIKKNDQVLIISGDDKGKKGKVLRALPTISKVIVEGVNLAKKHTKPKKQGAKGQIVSIPRPFQASNTMLICPKCGKSVRAGYEINGKQKTRVCKKCGAKI